MSQIRARLIAVLSDVQVHADRVEIRINREGLLSVLGYDLVDTRSSEPSVSPRLGEAITLTVPVRLRRTGIEMKLLLEDERSIGKPKPSLLKLLAGAFVIKERALNNPSRTIRDIAIAESVSDSYASRVLRLTYLPPDIVTAILDGRQPLGLSARCLLSRSRLPLDWAEQRQVLGFI